MNRIGNSLFHTGSNERLIKALKECAVDFVLIGGLAVAWYCQERQADDMDLLVNPTSENSDRIHKAFSHLKLCVPLISFSKFGLQIQLKQHFYAELLTPKENGPQYDEIKYSSINGSVFNIPILIASPSNLIRLKEQAINANETQKEKHLSDIELINKYIISNQNKIIQT